MWSCEIGQLPDFIYIYTEKRVSKFLKRGQTWLKLNATHLSNELVTYTLVLFPSSFVYNLKQWELLVLRSLVWCCELPFFFFFVFFTIPHINTEKLGIKNAAWGIPHKTYNAIKWAISTGNKMGMLSGIWIKPSRNRVRQPLIVLQALQKNLQGQRCQMQLTGQGRSVKKDNCSLQWKAGHSKFWLMQSQCCGVHLSGLAK